jgi:hypothetical protein
VLSHSAGGQKCEIKGSQDCGPSETPRRTFLPVSAAAVCNAQPHHSHPGLSYDVLPCVSCTQTSPCVAQPYWITAQPTPAWPHLNHSHLKWLCLPKRSHSEFCGQGQHTFLWDTSQLITSSWGDRIPTLKPGPLSSPDFTEEDCWNTHMKSVCQNWRTFLPTVDAYTNPVSIYQSRMTASISLCATCCDMPSPTLTHTSRGKHSFSELLGVLPHTVNSCLQKSPPAGEKGLEGNKGPVWEDLQEAVPLVLFPQAGWAIMWLPYPADSGPTALWTPPAASPSCCPDAAVWVVHPLVSELAAPDPPRSRLGLCWRGRMANCTTFLSGSLGWMV